MASGPKKWYIFGTLFQPHFLLYKSSQYLKMSIIWVVLIQLKFIWFDFGSSRSSLNRDMACTRITNQILIVNFLPGKRNRQEYYWRENSNFKICTTKIPSVEHLPSVRQVFLGNFSSISDNTVRTMSFWCPILETWDLSTLQYYSSREGDFYCNPDCFLLHAIWLFLMYFWSNWS